MNPSPFEVAQAIGSNISGAFQQRRDRSAIDDILSSAQSSGDTNAIDNAIGDILRRVSPANQQNALAILQERKNLLQRQAGLRAAGLDPNLAALSAKEIENVQKAQEKEVETSNQVNRIQTSMGRMIELLPKVGFLNKGRLGTSSTAEAFAEFEGLNVSLENALKSMVNAGKLTNSQFDFMIEKLPHPGDRQATIRGKLKAIGAVLGLPLSFDGESDDMISQQAPSGQAQVSLEELIPADILGA